MAKKTKKPKIYVKSPKIGESYHFLFLSMPYFGEIIRKDKKLTEFYNTPWFIIKDIKDGTKYPVAIHDIRDSVNKFKI